MKHERMKRLVKCTSLLLLFAVLAVNNLHLPGMQVVAWAGMLISYSQGGDLPGAIEMTFDGEHPCAMCKVIKAEQTNTKPDHIQACSALRILLFIESIPAWVQNSVLLETLSRRPLPLTSFSGQPELPPPRSAIS